MLQINGNCARKSNGRQGVSAPNRPDRNLIYLRRSRVADCANIVIPIACSSLNIPRPRGVSAL
jgi:hypothetical protein